MWWACFCGTKRHSRSESALSRALMSSDLLFALGIYLGIIAGSCISTLALNGGGERAAGSAVKKTFTSASRGIPRCQSVLRDYIAILASATLKRDITSPGPQGWLQQH